MQVSKEGRKERKTIPCVTYTASNVFRKVVFLWWWWVWQHWQHQTNIDFNQTCFVLLPPIRCCHQARLAVTCWHAPSQSNCPIVILCSGPYGWLRKPADHLTSGIWDTGIPHPVAKPTGIRMKPQETLKRTERELSWKENIWTIKRDAEVDKCRRGNCKLQLQIKHQASFRVSQQIFKVKLSC